MTSNPEQLLSVARDLQKAMLTTHVSGSGDVLFHTDSRVVLLQQYLISSAFLLKDNKIRWLEWEWQQIPGVK